MKSDILIVGTGALATLFAVRLTASGQRVTMLGTWKEGLDALHQDGARLVTADGFEQNYAVYATDDPRECRGAKYAIVLVKSWQTERAARQLKKCLAEDGLAITLQNGIGNREILAKYLDDQFTTERISPDVILSKAKNLKSQKQRPFAVPRITQGDMPPKNLSRAALGTTTTGATLLGPGLVKAGGEGIISIEAHPALGPVEEAIRSAKFNVEIVNDARSLVWGKLVINAAINPLTALLRVPNGELLNRPTARTLMRALAEEAAAVASAEEVKLLFSDPAAAAEDVARKTASNHSSMLQDVVRGAPTEIDSICGAITRAGKQHHIPTPTNEACWQLVQALAAVTRNSPAKQ